MNKLILTGICILFLNSLSLTMVAQEAVKYSFIVAGHAYGAHSGTNIGLHPNFLDAISTKLDSNLGMFFFTGDIVNSSNVESWQQVDTEMQTFKLPYYYSMGNHDANDVGYAVFNEKFGNSYYSFAKNNELYIILNSNETLKSISSQQVIFLQNTLESMSDQIKNVFVFFHEVLWNSHEKYMGVKSNSRSRYSQIIDYSNYWEDIHPLFEQYNDKHFYVIAGDVAGNPDAIPAFYDSWGNVTLVASGMGEVPEENYLLLKVHANDSIDMSLVPLNSELSLKPLEMYAVPFTPDTIFGTSLIGQSTSAFRFYVKTIKNAQAYKWQLPDNCSVVGSETDSIIELAFSSEFTSGEISVQATHESFGDSEAASLTVSRYLVGIKQFEQNENNIDVTVYFENGNCKLDIESKMPDCLTISVFDISGCELYTTNRKISGNQNYEFNINKPFGSIVFIKVLGERSAQVMKTMVK